MLTYADFQDQDRRLVLLRALESAAQYRANSFLLQRYCDHVGHVVSLDRIHADLAWLADIALVTQLVTAGTPDVTVATLTSRGLDVATGRATVPGVSKPKPGG